MSQTYRRDMQRVRPVAHIRLPRLRPLAWLVGAAMAQLGPQAVHADSGSGVDTMLGNALNPSGLSSARTKDPDGLGEAQHSRSPTGLMIPNPWLIREPRKAESGWLFTTSVEVGAIGLKGDKQSARFGEYKSLRNGLYLNNVSVLADKPDEAQYYELLGGAIGRDDKYFGLTLGQYNAWRVKIFYNDTVHAFTDRYRNLWSGTGTGRLTLNNLTAGPVAPATAATVDQAIGDAALATPNSTLSLVRHKGGMRADLMLPGDWKAFASYTIENRKGARPFGLAMGGGGGTGGVEIPESINYDTHDILAGAQWSNSRTSVNLQATLSAFRNNVGTMTVDNPMFLAAANGITSFPRATFDLYPDNDLYGAKAEFAHAMPEFYRARFTGVVSLNKSRQNDALIPSTEYAGATVNGVAGGAWNTPASLSKATAGAAIDTRLLDLGLALNPAAGLDVKAKVRQYETSNDTAYTACNPLTGQWGRLINDGSGSAIVVPNTTAGNNPVGTAATAYDAALCNLAAVQALGLVPSAGNANIRTVPYEYKQLNISLGADYRLARSQNLSGSIERETFDRAHRERDETWENRLKLGYVNRALVGGTLRVSLEHGERRGSTYVADPYEEFLSGSFGPLPSAATTNVTSWIHINDLHRKFDLADRDQSVVSLRWNHALREDLDLAVSAQLKDQRYPGSAYGRNGTQRQNTLGLDVNWQPSIETGVYGFVSQQDGRMTQTGLQQNACVLGSTYYFYSDGSINTTGTLTAAQTAAGITVVGNSGAVTAANFLSLCGSASATSPLYPTSRTWTATQKDKTTSFGFGVKHDFGKAKLDVNYNYTRGRTAVAYTYNAAALGLVTSGAPTAAQLTTLALIGSGFPDLVFRQDLVDASVLVPVNKTTAVRLLLRHEVGKFNDWHYDGVAANPTPAANQQTYLDAGPQDYKTTAVGAFVQFSW